ncbi:COQ9 protein [Opisthorchis viverrini]|uniref:COQ9 protein n=1 Tax=Opisthorchis viverrini TaxID=6198 RepID=A0A1S8WGU2_OPIVI|nr:COQ9 protein [Opisthorchis viverrini]
MTWYAKRLGLAYVYNLTEVYMLQDRSPNLADSWVFLESRLADLRSMKQMDTVGIAAIKLLGIALPAMQTLISISSRKYC